MQVEMEIRELLEKYGFDSTNTPVIAGSALCALEVCLRVEECKGCIFCHFFSLSRPK
jgi:translation elongation factor EF-Tu-like GTPase